MSPTWYSDEPPDETAEISRAGWVRVALRGGLIAVVLAVGVGVTVVLRLVERPLAGTLRPVTGWVTVLVFRATLRIMGLRLQVDGRVAEGRVAFVANHGTWLDILVFNAVAPLIFVAKAEVSGWPGIGWLARLVGTVFIARDRRRAAEQAALLRVRLLEGQRLLFFPEATSTDGLRVLPFKSTLFASFLDPALRDRLALQALSARYTAPGGAPERFYGWWGDMDLAPHLLKVLAHPKGGRVTVSVGPIHAAAGFRDRKAMAQALEADVRAGFERASAK